MKPNLVAWTVPFLRSASALLDMEIADEPAYVLLVHCEGGILGGHPGTPQGLEAFLAHMPKDRRIEWTVCCKEGNLFPIAMMSIALGG